MDSLTYLSSTGPSESLVGLRDYTGPWADFILREALGLIYPTGVQYWKKCVLHFMCQILIQLLTICVVVKFRGMTIQYPSGYSKLWIPQWWLEGIKL